MAVRNSVSTIFTWFRRPSRRRLARERAQQQALARSWQGAVADLADPARRARLEASLQQLRHKYEPRNA